MFRLPADAWGRGVPVIAQLVDSLPIVPGTAPLRFITDASLSPDARFLAVRTYAQVFTFATDSVTGRVIARHSSGRLQHDRHRRNGGEGITWFGRSSMLLFDGGRTRSPMFAVDCPMPRRD